MYYQYFLFSFSSDVKRSVAERKEQITRKLSSSKIPASKQKKEIREEIMEIKTQIKPDIKKFQDIEQQVKIEPKLERTRSKTSPESVEEEKEIEVHRAETVEIIKEEPKVVERPVEQFRKFDPSSPGKPTPKHLQRHMRNESMRFPSGDFSNITVTPRKSVTAETSEVKQTVDTKIETFTKETISQKEIYSSRVEEKLDDGDRSPDLEEDVKDIALAPLKQKISSFESKMSKESSIDLPKATVKLTKEALKKHTMEQGQGIEYTQEFVRKQSEQLSNLKTIDRVTQKVSVEKEQKTETVKSVKETIQRFDSKPKIDDKVKPFPKTIRTDSTLVQVSSEEDSEFLKKSTDSETETESQTTVKVDIEERKLKSKLDGEVFDKRPETKTKTPKDKAKHEKPKKPDDDDKKGGQGVAVKVQKIERQMTEELRSKVSEEELTETFEEKDVSISDKTKDKVSIF